jgi:uncharacterized protein YdiU (UPF0061 family)
MTLSLPFDNSYARLPDRFFAQLDPTPVSDPGLLAVNDRLAWELGLSPQGLKSDEALNVFAGNHTPTGATPLAQAYAGHQFGHWNPGLGDGRAILLGELVTLHGDRFDLQLKGAGRTPFSRSGDGRAWLGPVLREYVVSEAMHALGIPTTRALAAVSTGDPVIRDTVLPGAILTRIAPSHIRVGTFQYFASRGDVDALNQLFAHVRDRHYPDIATPLDLLDAVVTGHAKLIAQWMGVGFIHGVMNTDNAHVAGITIDYGPCAFMDRFSPNQVYSSIDQYGRYAYDQQPAIAGWNMAQLATALLPLMGEQDAAIKDATEVVHRFAPRFQTAWLATFRAKLGLTTEEDDDEPLIHDLLDLMTTGQADFTNTFRALGTSAARDQFLDRAAFDAWTTRYEDRLAHEPDGADTRRAAANPALIPRNHRIEEMIEAAVQGDLELFHRLTTALAHPFDMPEDSTLTAPPTEAQIVRATFCGT